jgi:hypothetical protein
MSARTIYHAVRAIQYLAHFTNNLISRPAKFIQIAGFDKHDNAHAVEIYRIHPFLLESFLFPRIPAHIFYWISRAHA